jgi:hypothetical protein
VNEDSPLIQILSQTESWLYEKGSETQKEAYQSKLDSLKTCFAEVHSRYSQYEALPELLTSLAGLAALA